MRYVVNNIRCGNSARRDLSGGRRATGLPAATDPFDNPFLFWIKDDDPNAEAPDDELTETLRENTLVYSRILLRELQIKLS